MKLQKVVLIVATLAICTLSLGAQAMGVDVTAIAAQHGDVLAGLAMVGFAGEIDIPGVKEAIKQSLDDLTKEHKEALKLSKETTEQALAEVKKFGTLTTETNVKLTEIGTKTQELQAQFLDMQQKVDKFKTFTPDQQAKTVADIIVESQQYKDAGKAGRPQMDAVEVGSFFKTAIINATGQNQPLVPAERAPMVMPAQRPLVIRDLLPTSPTQSNLIEFVKENVFTNNAAIVQAGGAYENITKPESAITFVMATAPVITIAHWIPASRQVLADASMLRGYIGNRLTYGLAFVEEDEILNGDGSAGHLNGLMTQAAAYAGAGAVSLDQQLDTLLRAFTQVYTGSLFAPDGVVVNPVDWTKICLIKDTTGRYVFGDPNSDKTPSVWGKPLVQSLSIAATRFLAGAFKPSAQLWDRETATVRIAEQHGDFFVKNMVAILAEERMALTVYRPTGLVRGNFN